MKLLQRVDWTGLMVLRDDIQKMLIARYQTSWGKQWPATVGLYRHAVLISTLLFSFRAGSAAKSCRRA